MSTDPLKEWRNLQAALLLAGFGATLTDDDAGRPMLTVSRWAFCRSFVDLTEAQAWARHVGVRS